ncbi:MAG: hypothetical protein AMJ55_09620 [Gammaproteobacteria bacterium SG8_15]|nr:MAG: hypothetical protein AMJ55_09620 [Gammaproteobacteria bacterium SG8_15]
MGHNAFVERYDRPNYKLHVIIFLAIAAISIFLSTQVEKTRDNTDVAALKTPVPIDSIAIDGEAAARQSQPSVKPPIVAQNASLNGAPEPMAISETVQEYRFEDAPNLENINALLNIEAGQAELATATSAPFVNNEESSVTTDQQVAEVAAMQSDEPAAEKATTQLAEAEETGEAESPMSLDQVFQKQNDRFLETLAKTAQEEPEESAEIKQLKEAIRSDKPLDDNKAKSATVTAAVSDSDEKKSQPMLTAARPTPTTSETEQLETKQIIVKPNVVKQTAQMTTLTANVQPASQRITSTGGSSTVVSRSQRQSTETVVMTRGELDNVVNQFTNSYNEGDINRLMALFAENASTNDRQNKLGIKADYAELFNNTKTRKLMINDINWQLGKGKAEGAAEFVVTVQAKNGMEESSFHGHIKITAIKQSKGVYITRLLHQLKQ